jgi:hypothetical protein
MSSQDGWRDRFAPDYDKCASPRCQVPGRIIEPGDTVLYDGTGLQVHEDCEVPGA